MNTTQFHNNRQGPVVAKHTVMFNATMNTILMGSNALLSLITIPYVTRVLSVEGFGSVGFAQSVAAWFSVFCLFGIPLYGVRECAKVRDNPVALATVVKELLILLTIFTGICLSIFALCIVIIPQFRAEAPLMWIFLVNTLLASYGSEWFFQAVEQYRYITVRSVLFKAATLVTVLIFVKNPNDYVLYGFLLALGLSANNVWNIVRLRTLVPFSRAEKTDCQQHLKPLISFVSQGVASSVYLSLDSVILAIVSASLFQVGLYQLVVKLKGFLVLAITSVVSVLIPRLSYLIEVGEGTEYKQLLSKSFHAVLSISLAICGYVFIFADLLVSFVSSQKYIAAAMPLRISGITVLLTAMSVFIGYAILTPIGREKEFAIANIAGIPISLILNIVLDRSYGAVGASIALLCTEVCVVLLQCYFIRDRFATIVNKKELAKTIAAIVGAISIAVLCRCATGGMAVVAQLFIGSCVFCIFWGASLVLLRERSALLFLHKITEKM